MRFKEVELTDKILSELIACSEAWEQENSCHGYRKNTEEDIKGNRIFLALENEQMVGQLFGCMDKGERKNSIYEKDEPFFEVEELYVKPELRSCGIGKQLFQYMEEKMKEAKKENEAVNIVKFSEIGIEDFMKIQLKTAKIVE